MHQVIGKGGFGLVRIVEVKTTKQQYALKYINKRQCIKKDSMENVFRERLMMQELDHPFIINLRFAFQDDEYMFIGLDLALGGDLRFHILRQAGLTEQTIKVYSAEISLALSYIHSKHIIHRDLKPENLLIDLDGHVRITDFNVAYSTKVKFPSSRSGTMNYMAPEMFSGKRYTYAVDWWALGVVMFESFYGIKPFRGDDDRQVVHQIKSGELHFPKDYGIRGTTKPDSSNLFKDIMYSLMTTTPTKRLGGESMDAFSNGISTHEWFGDIDWPSVYERKVFPDFIPDMSKSNFEAAPALEELLYDSSPLTPKRRKKKTITDNSVVLNRDSLAASLSASLTSSPSTSHNSPNMSNMSDKEKQKEQERRQMAFIETHFTVYVQGSGIGVLDTTTLNRLAIQNSMHKLNLDESRAFSSARYLSPLAQGNGDERQTLSASASTSSKGFSCESPKASLAIPIKASLISAKLFENKAPSRLVSENPFHKRPTISPSKSDLGEFK
ncbi:hypothetical protein BDEG_25216 [Batrachochytrium dendrobatidis JEL423]|nr:hypothetical protein BDEG_25216 [Batrachochytrium dendrobatidis JEL423]